MSELKPVAYRCYAEFFDREFKEGVRPFSKEPGLMGAFGEARYFGWEELDPAQRFPVILTYTKQNIETLIRVGDTIAEGLHGKGPPG